MVRNRLYISKYDRNINSIWYDYKPKFISYEPQKLQFQFHMVRL